jgi:glycosyltransferase involved in cell wall biosynthesis
MDMQKNKILTIVIPVYNEAENIKNTLDALELYTSYFLEVLIVYDQPTDTTIAAVQSIQDNYRLVITLVQNQYGRGALNAIKTGFNKASGDAVLVVMADMADDFRAIPAMFEQYVNSADIVCGSRYMPGGKQVGGPLIKGLMSRVAGVSLYYLTALPTHDITNSFKLYRTSLLRSIPIESTGGFELGMEITVKAFLQGYSIVEVPSVWTDRTVGQSRFNLLTWIPHYLYWYILLQIKRGPLYLVSKKIRFLYCLLKKGIAT